jgi:FkbM family methyltransferase
MIPKTLKMQTNSAILMKQKKMMRDSNIRRPIFSRIAKRFYGSYLVLLGDACVYSHGKYAHHSLTFSQEGEDSILQRIFERKSIGFYVDVGSHHPQRFSNTYRFYLRGWNGINIDPLPGSKARFDALRQRDINIELGISDHPGELTYYSFQEPAFNTFDSKVAGARESPLLSVDQVRVLRLRDVLDQHLKVDQRIDFLNIDVEGLDIQVLRSNDWKRYRPSYVLAEALGMRDVDQVLNSELHAYMVSQGYSLFAKCVNTLFFADSSASESVMATGQ